MLPVLNIGPLAIQAPGFILIIGFWVGLTQSEKYARRIGIEPDRVYNLAMIGLLAGIVGARISYLGQRPETFIEAPLSLFTLTPNMLDLFGGVVFGALAAAIYAQRKKIPAWLLLDALTPGLAILLITLGFANLASGNAYGTPSNLPWSIEMWGASRHPTQAYEILLASASALLIWPRKNSPIYPPGLRFLALTILTALSRTMIEAFRGDSVLAFGNIRAAQIIAGLILIGAVILMNIKLKSLKETRPE